MQTYFVLIVECSDKSYFIDITDNLYKKLDDLNLGTDRKCFTYTRRPVTLKFYETFRTLEEALAARKQLQGWSRKKKEALFERNWEKIQELAKCRTGISSTSSEKKLVSLDP